MMDEDRRKQAFDVVQKPQHYNVHPSGIEVIEVVRKLNFNLGCVFKYVMRYEFKEPARSLGSALWYLADDRSHPLRTVLSDRQMNDLIADITAIEVDEPDVLRKEFVSNFFEYLTNTCERTYLMVRLSLEKMLVRAKGEEIESIARDYERRTADPQGGDAQHDNLE